MTYLLDTHGTRTKDYQHKIAKVHLGKKQNSPGGDMFTKHNVS